MSKKVLGRIYCVENKTNQKLYIGKTTLTIQMRWSGHCACRGTSAIENAIRKYGPDNFTIREIDSAATREELNALERHWIAKLNTRAPCGYNLRPGGEGGPHHHSTLMKMRAEFSTPEYRAKKSGEKKKFWSDPENKKRMLAIMVRSDVMGKRVTALKQSWTEERKTKHAAYLSAWHTPEKRALKGEKSRAAWSKPGAKESISATIKRIRSTPEEKAKLSALRKADWNDPEKRGRYMAAKMRFLESAEGREKISVGVKAKCADREWLARRTAAIVAAKARKKALRT